MLSMPRFARVFLLALVLVTVPTAFYFYPSSSPNQTPSEVRLDQGGIDSDHWREPVPPPEQLQLEEDSLAAEPQPESPAEMVPDHEAEVEDEGERGWKQEMQDWGLGDHHNVGGDTGFGRVQQEGQGGKGASGGGDGGELMSADEGSGTVEEDVINGAVIMPHLGNATAKAELGRAAWRVLHLMTLRYPEKPTPDDRAALKSFFHLFSRLYPCGECAEHFQKMLKKYPPQTSSRKSASLWLCSIHNMVNERLGKPEFDCLTLDKTYDCGCNGTSTAAVPAATGSTALLDSAAD